MKYRVTRLLTLVFIIAIGSGLIACGGAEDRKEVYIEKAKNHIQNNSLEKARIELKNSLQIDPKNAESHFLLGEVSYFKKELGKAINSYKKAIELNSNFDEAKIALAKAYSVTDYEVYLNDADKLLDEVEKNASFNEKAGVVKATILIKKHKNIEAENILKGIIDKNSGHINAYNTLGYLYFAEGRHKDVIKLFEQGISKNPENMQLLMSLADVYSKLNLYAEAEGTINKVISLKPDKYSYKAALVALYVSNNELGKAEKILRNEFHENPGDLARTTTLINFLAQHRSMQTAITELESIIKSQPDRLGVKYSLSNYYFSVGLYEKSISILDEIIAADSLSPLAVEARVKKANIYFKQKKYDEVKNLLDIVFENNRKQLDALFLKGKLDFLTNNLDDAINTLRLVVKEQADHKEAPLILAEALKKQGNMQLAISSLQEAINIVPGNFQAYIDFSNFLASNDNIDMALNVINNAADLFKTNFDVLKQKFKILAALRKKDDILDLIDHMKSVFPARYEVYQLSGMFFTKTEKYDLAVEDFKLALSKTKEPYLVYRSLIDAYLLNKKKSELYSFLNAESRNKDRQVPALQALGDLYYFDRKFKEAEDNYNKALIIQADWVHAYEGLIKIAVYNKDSVKAIDYFKKAIEVSKEKLNVEIELVRFYIAKSKYLEADNLFKEMLIANPYNTSLINNYASFVLEYMNDDEHLNQISKLITTIEKSANPSFQETVAWYYVNTKQYDNALVIYQKIIDNFKTSAEVQYHYGYALFMSGDKHKAKSHLEAALKSDAVFKGKEDIQKLINQI